MISIQSTSVTHNMTIHKAYAADIAGDQVSRAITDSNEVSACRTTVTSGSGAAIGATTGSGVIGASAAGATTLAAAAGVFQS